MTTAKARLIVVDDEVDVRLMLTEYLGGAGYLVRAAADGTALRRLLEHEAADLIILDLGLPGEDGLSLARWVRERHDLGVVMLTGADTTMDRILGLEIGADDYIGKPFQPRELVARIEAVLRRRRPVSVDAALPDGALRFGRYTLQLKPRRLLHDDAGGEVDLTGMELDLVQAFAGNAGRAMTRDEILDLAPPRGDEPFDRSIDNRITRLRRKLERDPAKPELIKTVRGAGYLYPGS
ncbi:MAG: response regulator [Geminicoccaceae bacterium]